MTNLHTEVWGWGQYTVIAQRVCMRNASSFYQSKSIRRLYIERTTIFFFISNVCHALRVIVYNITDYQLHNMYYRVPTAVYHVEIL